MKGYGRLFRQQGSYSLLIYGLCGLLVVLIQTAPHGFPAIFHVRPTPLVPFVVCVAVLEGAKIGAVTGTISGLLWGLYSFRLFGMDALLLLGIGLAAGLLVEWLLRANFYSALLLCASGIFVQSTVEWLLCYALLGKPQTWTVLWRVYLPGGVYTFLLSPLLYGAVLYLARRIRRRFKTR